MSKKKILITGASGLIGTNLVDYLLARNYHVIGIAKDFPLSKLKLDQFSSSNFIFIEGNITDKVFLNKVFQENQPNIVIHLAAQAIVDLAVSSPYSTFDVNVNGTLNILEESMKLKNLERVIIASSDKAYGSHLDLPYKEDFSLNAKFPYDLSKKMTEELAMSYFDTYQLPIVISRCGNVFGSYDLNLSRIVPGTIFSCLSNEKIILRSDGEQKRCYVFAEDVANAYLKMIESPIDIIRGQTFNIGNDEPLRVIELTKLICELSNVNPAENIIIKNNSKFEISNQYLDCTKANKILEWKPSYDLNTALIKTINWYKINFTELKTLKSL